MIHDILISRQEARIILKIWEEGLDLITREERKLYAEMLTRFQNVLKK